MSLLSSLFSGFGNIFDDPSSNPTVGGFFNGFSAPDTFGSSTSATDLYNPAYNGGTVAPTMGNSAGALDKAADLFGKQMTRGRTSTMLTGGRGENEALLNTSSILLGR